MPEFENESARACEYLLRRYGPKFMRLGGSTEDSRDSFINPNYKPAKKITAKMIAKMVRLYDGGNGLNREEISAKMGLGHITVWRHLRKAGVWNGYVVKKVKP